VSGFTILGRRMRLGHKEMPWRTDRLGQTSASAHGLRIINARVKFAARLAARLCCMPDRFVLKITLDQPARLADGLGIKVNPVRSWIRPNGWFPRFAALCNGRCKFGLPDFVHA